MSNEQIKCKFIDQASHLECSNWYQADEHQSFCQEHRDQATSATVNHIPRTVKVMPESHLTQLNERVLSCSQMRIPDLVDHIQRIEDQIKKLELERRAANIAKRNLEDRLTDSERAELRQQSRGFVPEPEKKKRSPYAKRDPEEKASKRKGVFSAWAARLGLKTDDLIAMDEDELASKIAKYKAKLPSKTA